MLTIFGSPPDRSAIDAHDFAGFTLIKDLDPTPRFHPAVARKPLVIRVAPKWTAPADFTLGLRPGETAREPTHGADLALTDHYESNLSLLESVFRAQGEDLRQPRPTWLFIDPAVFTGAFAIRLAEFWPVYVTWLHRLEVRTLAIGPVPAGDEAVANEVAQTLAARFERIARELTKDV